MLRRRIASVFALSCLFVLVLCSFAFAAETKTPPPNFGVLSLLPPIVAIGLCLSTREVIPALFIGSWVAGMILCHGNPILGFGKAVEQLWNAMGDPWGARIILTCIAMGGMVGVMQVGGGIKSAIKALSKKINGSRSAMIFTEIAGFVIFFEDYVNAAVVGTTMAPVTDTYRISKEKLSYLVDSTSAPVACIAGISSWVAYMVGQIGTQYKDLGITASPYMTYLQSIPFVFYNIITLLLMTWLVCTERDFGPMLTAERRARSTGKLIRDGGVPLAAGGSGEEDLTPADDVPMRVMNFVLPLIFMVGTIFAMLLITGGYPSVSFSKAMGDSDSSRSLVYGAFAGCTLTILFYWLQRIAPLTKLFRGFLKGGQTIFVGSMILVFAWGISSSIKSVGTAVYIVSIAKDLLSPSWIPVMTFVVGMIISYCTGTSYGTMAILMPIVVPLIVKVSAAGGTDPNLYMLPTIGAVFAGAVWGDHCSPISDTTIMSSMFSGSDHMDHVSTQMPYASLAAAGAFISYVCMAFGINHWLALLIGTVLTIIVFQIISKPVDDFKAEA